MARWKKVVLGIFAVPLLVVIAFVLRATVFAPRYDVPSIALTREYQDPSLLERAWQMPVASTYERRVDFQSNGSICGPTSLANVLRSLDQKGATVDQVLAGTGKCGSGFCFMGLTLDELGAIAERKSGRKVRIVRDLTLEALRAELRHANDPHRRIIANFQRGLLFGKGTGHHSPVAAYLEEEDLVLVLDVNASFGPWLVSTERLFRAIDSVDGSSGKKRGLLVIE